MPLKSTFSALCAMSLVVAVVGDSRFLQSNTRQTRTPKRSNIGVSVEMALAGVGWTVVALYFLADLVRQYRTRVDVRETDSLAVALVPTETEEKPPRASLSSQASECSESNADPPDVVVPAIKITVINADDKTEQQLNETPRHREAAVSSFSDQVSLSRASMSSIGSAVSDDGVVGCMDKRSTVSNWYGANNELDFNKKIGDDKKGSLSDWYLDSKPRPSGTTQETVMFAFDDDDFKLESRGSFRPRVSENMMKICEGEEDRPL
mmetsp:Transcript_59106/g.157294  ORF Transcript_59106/g.157294 Transcript_59106/m.157294 type:complete len:264 (-) Transcript_59106:101-892(-)